MSDLWVIILLSGLLTYVTRIGGYLIVARAGKLSPRMEAGLNAVPAAVLTTIVVPSLVDGTWAERLIVLACLVLSLRLPLIGVIAIGAGAAALAHAAGY
ncbi:AzlD family protein [Mangrovicella endophytica]|uniref:AzlD family protein n=1 Tax=Mangrovicella endophytica TaxID=2066697 RepID=UPI000C9E3AF9|nr:AzlD domain-containing protein [Mangrovicella endophytica]